MIGCSLALALAVPKGFGIFLALAFLVALATLRRDRLAQLRATDWIFLLLINVYPLLVMLSMVLHGLTDSGLIDTPSRFTILSVVYIALRSRDFRLRDIVVGAMAGCALTFCASVVDLAVGSQALHGSQGRFVAFDNAIVFGQIAFFLLLIATTPISLPQLSVSRLRALLVVLILMASSTLVITQSRGVLMALLMLLVYLLFFDPRFPGARRVRLAMLVCGLTAGAYLFSTPHLDHLGGTTSELIANYEQVDQLTSLGQRLAQWSFAGRLIVEEPLLGHGVGEFREALARLPDTASLTERVRGYNHVHNDLLQISVEQGVIAALVFLTSLLSIGYLAYRERFGREARHLLFGALVFWLFFSLTQTQLAHQKTTMMLALLLVVGFAHGMSGRYGALNYNST